jgi:TorA maturation chaperone TorD
MEYLKARANMYEILKTAFSLPDKVLATEIIVGSFAGRIQETVEHCCSLAAQCCLPPDLMAEIRKLPQSMEGKSDQSDFLVSLNVEYMRLFVNAFPTLWAPPYESYYVEKKVMGKPALDCLALYREDGLALNKSGELPDHIVTQLEYLYFLCLAAIQAMVIGDRNLVQVLEEKKHRFYEDHIMNWVPAFCDQIQSHSDLAFYRVISRLLKNFVVLENKGHSVEKLGLFEEVRQDEATGT